MATLKISDLSVGDWVSFDTVHLTVEGDDIATAFVKKVQQPARIKSILGDQDLIFAEVKTEDDFGTIYLKMEHIRPIPITAEILERNGFEEYSKREWGCNDDSPYHTFIHIGTPDGTMWFISFPTIFNLTWNHPIYHIHDLQHLIRLVGVDKEINL